MARPDPTADVDARIAKVLERRAHLDATIEAHLETVAHLRAARARTVTDMDALLEERALIQASTL